MIREEVTAAFGQPMTHPTAGLELRPLAAWSLCVQLKQLHSGA